MPLDPAAHALAVQLGHLLRSYIESDGSNHETMELFEAFRTGFGRPAAAMPCIEIPVVPADLIELTKVANQQYGRHILANGKLGLDDTAMLTVTATRHQLVIEPPEDEESDYKNHARIVITLADDGKSCIVVTVDRHGLEHVTRL